MTTEASMPTAFHSPLAASSTKEQSSRVLNNKNKSLPQEGLFLDHFQGTHHHFQAKKYTSIIQPWNCDQRMFIRINTNLSGRLTLPEIQSSVLFSVSLKKNLVNRDVLLFLLPHRLQEPAQLPSTATNTKYQQLTSTIVFLSRMSLLSISRAH